MTTWVPASAVELKLAEAISGEGMIAQSLEEGIEILVGIHQGYKNAYNEEVAKRSDIFGRISSLEAEAASYKNAYDEEVDKRADRFGRISTLEAEAAGYKKAYDEEVAKRAERFGRISSLEAEAASYKKAYDEEIAKRSETLGRVSTLEAEAAGYKKAYDEEVARRSEIFGRISTLEAEVAGYKKAYDEEVARRSEVFGRISNLEAEVAGYRNAYNEEVARRSEIFGRISSLEAEVAGYRRAYDEEVAKRSEIFGRISSLEAERDGYAQAYRDAMQQRDEARRTARQGSADISERTPGPRQPAPVRKSIADQPPASRTKEATMSAQHKFDLLVEAGRAEERAGRRDAAVDRYMGAMRLLHRYGPAKIELDRIAKDLLRDAIAKRSAGERDAAQLLLVRSLELNPESQEVRDTLQSLLDDKPGRDLTQECMIFPDVPRATRWYREAIQTCMDFVAFGGVEGEILEFGVLGGWTARHFAEIARDMGWYGDLHLFDSFEGLPRMKGEVDRASYDVARGIWMEEMALPKSWEAELGGPIEVHIKRQLSQVLSPSRIKVRKGFYSDSLRQPLDCKAALVHMDCDLYQSTVEVFQALERDAALQDGTIIMFDDWNCNRANPAFGQRRAFAEFQERNKRRWQTSHYMNYGFNCAAFILHKVSR